jgi:hypothetical protein
MVLCQSSPSELILLPGARRFSLPSGKQREEKTKLLETLQRTGGFLLAGCLETPVIFIYINETTGSCLSWSNDFCPLNKQCSLTHSNCVLASWSAANQQINLVGTPWLILCLSAGKCWDVVTGSWAGSFPWGCYSSPKAGLPSHFWLWGFGRIQSLGQKTYLTYAVSVLGWTVPPYWISIHLKKTNC